MLGHWNPCGVAAAGSDVAAAVATLPAGAVVLLGVVMAVSGVAGRYLLARERTRRLEVGMAGAANVYKAGGDGAAVARGLREDVPSLTPRIRKRLSAELDPIQSRPDN
jgi:hypothetical protein